MTRDPQRGSFVAGHRGHGRVGPRAPAEATAWATPSPDAQHHAELDLTRPGRGGRVLRRSNGPSTSFSPRRRWAASIANNTYPAEFIRDNLAIQTNVIHAAHRSGVQKLLFLGSSCIYPKLAPQPMREDALLTGALEPTNEPYAIAKIAGIKMCQAYRRQYGFNAISVMPTNLYGPNDNFHLQNSHVLPAPCCAASTRRQTQAMRRSWSIWGTGTPRREFLHVDDWRPPACI